MSKGHTYTYVRILFITVVLAVCGDSGPVEAGVWDAIKEYYQALQLDELDEESIPETPVEYAGEVGLELQRRVEIPFNEETPGIGEVQWIGITPEGTLLLTDLTARQAHEFSLDDGRYIRAFGRKGSGPGEYMSADNMAVDPQGRVYLLDLSQILRYDRQGRFLDKTRSIQGCQVLTGRNGELFYLKVNPSKIMELQRRDPATWAVLDRTPLSTKKQNFITYRMTYFVRMCYSAASHRIYYLGANDYKVKEINADTNEVIRQFGQRPEGFMSLPRRYHGIGRGTREDMQDLWQEISYLRSMTLVQDRYLVICYVIDLYKIAIFWLVYDLESAVGIRAYVFNQDGKDRLASFGYNAIPVTAWRDRLYMWRVPSAEAVETSNGTVEVYALSFATN